MSKNVCQYCEHRVQGEELCYIGWSDCGGDEFKPYPDHTNTLADAIRDRDELAELLEIAARDFVGANGMRPVWWHKALPIIARIKEKA